MLNVFFGNMPESLYNSRTVSYGSEGEILWLIVSLLSGFVKKKLTGWT